MKIAITGASGFIGRALTSFLAEQGHELLLLVREGQQCLSFSKQRQQQRFDLEQPERIEMLDLQGVDALIHCAGLAHDLSTSALSEEHRYDRANHQTAVLLAQQCKQQGVDHFIFLCTSKVHGANTTSPLTESSAFDAQTAYTRSKVKAEQGIQQCLEGSATAFTIIRPSLVYALDAKGNFAQLLKLCRSTLPIPLAQAKAHRQMLSRDTLVAFIHACLSHEQARNQVFLLSDKQAISTANLVRALREGMGQSAKLWPIPALCIKLGCRLVGKPQWYEQLFLPFELDVSKAEQVMSLEQTGHYRDFVGLGQAYLNEQLAKESSAS